MRWHDCSMVKKTKNKKTASDKRVPFFMRPMLFIRRWLLRMVLAVAAFLVLWIAAYSLINPPTTPYIMSEGLRLGGVTREWKPIEEIAPVMAQFLQ